MKCPMCDSPLPSSGFTTPEGPVRSVVVSLSGSDRRKCLVHVTKGEESTFLDVVVGAGDCGLALLVESATGLHSGLPVVKVDVLGEFFGD